MKKLTPSKFAGSGTHSKKAKVRQRGLARVGGAYDLHFIVRKNARFFRLASAALPPQVPGSESLAGPRAQRGYPG